MRIAVFDIDGTLIRGTSTEKRFFSYLARHGIVGPYQWLGLTAGAVASLRFGRHFLKKNKGYLQGLEPQRVEDAAREWVLQELPSMLYAPVVECVRDHQRRGDHVVLLSGTLACVAAAVADSLGVGESLGTLVPQRDGRFSRLCPSVHPFGEEKRRLISSFGAAQGVGLERIVAYGDSYHDLPLLESVGAAVAVRPDRRLRAIARHRGWRIIDDDSADCAAPARRFDKPIGDVAGDIQLRSGR